jgi:glycosyltransferase involved in cell wall biosynthesis
MNNPKDTQNPQCSIIVRCYNEEQHIGRLLSGIMQQTVKNVEIIIVDSGSTDASLSIASRYPTRVVYIDPEEFSFGRALNVGCKAATGKYIVNVSAHVYPLYNDWLERLLAPFDDPLIALVYGKQRGNEITKFSEHQIFSKLFPDRSNLKSDHPFCNNANAAIRHDLWEQIPYNEYLTGLEDLDWAKQVIDKGYYITYAADAEIIHVHNETFLKIFNRYRREAIALKHINPHEHFNLLDFINLFAGNVVNDYYNAWNKKVLWNQLISISLFRLMQFSGTYIGFSQRSAITRSLKQTFYYPNGRKNTADPSRDRESKQTIDYSKILNGDINE